MSSHLEEVSPVQEPLPMDFGAPITVRQVKVRSLPTLLTEDEVQQILGGGQWFGKRVWFIGSGLLHEEETKPSKDDVRQAFVIVADSIEITDIGHKK